MGYWPRLFHRMMKKNKTESIIVYLILQFIFSHPCINSFTDSSNKYFWFWKQMHNCNVRSCLSISSKLPNIVKKQNNRTKYRHNIALKYLNVVSSECLYIGCILSICVSNVYSRENFSLSLKASLSLKPRTKRYPLKALYYTIQRECMTL